MKTATSFSIRQGNCHALRARRGATVLCSKGALRVIEPPALIYENMVWRRTLLHAGQAYVVEQAGWLHCVAISDTQIGYMDPPPSPLGRLLAYGIAILGKGWGKIRPARGLGRLTS